jgi:oligopeptide transport system substrate-binding protein
MLMMHQLKEPFTDQKVREAFAYALDRETWVSDVLNGMGAPAVSWIPPGFPGADETETRFQYDLDAAKAAIAESSYGSFEALPPITLTFSDSPRNRTRWEWLAAKYKESLGVDMTLNPVEPTTYTALTKDVATAPQMFILGWCADYPDPQNWLSVYWMTGAFGERIGFSNAELDALMKEADATLDEEERMTLYDDAQKMLVGLAPGAMFWNNVNSYLVKPWVKGVKYTPMDAGFPGSYTVLDIEVDRP